MAEYRVKFWSKYWCPAGTADFNSGFGQIKDKAREESELRDPILASEVRQALKHSPKKTAPGADLWVPSVWTGRPEEADAVLASILNLMEMTLKLPVQMLLNVIVMQGKPNGGERGPSASPQAFTGFIARLEGPKWSLGNSRKLATGIQQSGSLLL